MIKVLIVDDEVNSIKIIKQALELFSDISIVGIVNSGLDAIKFIKDNPVDIVFLDIEMDEMNGFEVASYLHNNYSDIQYVFVTGHSDFAVDGYSYQPLSFLIKPISITRLEQVLELAKEKINLKNNQSSLIDKQIGIHVDSRLEIVNVNDIAYLETSGRKVRVVCKDGRILETNESLKKLYQIFEDYGFYRSHQSFVVQISLIESISSDMFRRSYLIKLKNIDKNIPLSRDNYSNLKSILEDKGIKMI